MSRFRCVRSCCRRWMLSLKEFSVRSAGEASRSSQLQIKIGPKKKNFSFFLGNIDYTWKSVWPTIFGARAHWVLGCVSLALRVTSLIVVTTWTRGLFQGSKCESKIFINFFPDKFSFFFVLKFWIRILKSGDIPTAALLSIFRSPIAAASSVLGIDSVNWARTADLKKFLD